MLCLQSAPSAESSTADQSGYKPRQTGVWLSLSPPKIHNCPFCDKSFNSPNALGGHQNAHRSLRNKMQKMYYMKFLGERNSPPFDFPIDDDDDDPAGDTSSPVPTKRARNNTIEPVANDDSAENEIYLELRLGSVKEGKEFGVGAPSGSGVNKAYDAETQYPYTSPVAYAQFLQLQLSGIAVRSGANECGVGVGVADEYVGWLCGRRGTRKVINNTGLDVTLKL